MTKNVDVVEKQRLLNQMVKDVQRSKQVFARRQALFSYLLEGAQLQNLVDSKPMPMPMIERVKLLFEPIGLDYLVFLTLRPEDPDFAQLELNNLFMQVSQRTVTHIPAAAVDIFVEEGARINIDQMLTFMARENTNKLNLVFLTQKTSMFTVESWKKISETYQKVFPKGPLCKYLQFLSTDVQAVCGDIDALAFDDSAKVKKFKEKCIAYDDQALFSLEQWGEIYKHYLHVNAQKVLQGGVKLINEDSDIVSAIDEYVKKKSRLFNKVQKALVVETFQTPETARQFLEDFSSLEKSSLSSAQWNTLFNRFNVLSLPHDETVAQVIAVFNDGRMNTMKEDKALKKMLAFIDVTDFSHEKEREECFSAIVEANKRGYFSPEQWIHIRDAYLTKKYPLNDGLGDRLYRNTVVLPYEANVELESLTARFKRLLTKELRAICTEKKDVDNWDEKYIHVGNKLYDEIQNYPIVTNLLTISRLPNRIQTDLLKIFDVKTAPILFTIGIALLREEEQLELLTVLLDETAPIYALVREQSELYGKNDPSVKSSAESQSILGNIAGFFSKKVSQSPPAPTTLIEKLKSMRQHIENSGAYSVVKEDNFISPQSQ